MKTTSNVPTKTTQTKIFVPSKSFSRQFLLFYCVQGRTKPWVIGSVSPSLQSSAGEVGFRHQLVRFYDADDIQNASCPLNWNDNIDKAHVCIQMIHEWCSWRRRRLHHPCDPLPRLWNVLCKYAAKSYIPAWERGTYKVEVHKKISEKDAYSGTKGMSIYLLSTIRNQQLSL